jgi:hypothetical protein
MSANGFREDELITRKMNGQTRVFPVVGGRLRLAHEGNQKLSLQTELVSWDGNYAVFRCVATTEKGQFVGYGTANNQRDARLAESLLELSETRSIARALRFAGYGLEYCGAEEVSHVMETEPVKVFNDGHGSKGQRCPIDRPSEGKGESKPKRCGTGQVTTAQVRALYALTKKAQYTEQDIESMLSPLEADTFQQLTREDASRLISYLQTEVAA